MAEVVRYTDMDVSGGSADGTSLANAYATPNAWEAAEQSDIAAAGDTHLALMYATSGTSDTSSTSISSWVTSSTSYVTVRAGTGQEAVVSGWSDSIFRKITTDDQPWETADNHVRFENLQFRVVYSATATVHGLLILFIAADNDIRVSGCRIEGDTNASATGNGIYTADGDVIIKVYNCIINGHNTAGINMQNCTTCNVYNTVIHTCGSGVLRAAGTVTVTNVASFNCTDDFNGTITIDYCASDDGDGTNAVAPSGSNWANEYADYANGDMTAQGGNTGDGGTDDPASGLFSVDMDGTTYTSTWPIGVDEYAGGGGGSIVPLMMEYYS